MNSKIEKAISLLKQGKVVITPSESSYGFSCDASNKEAVSKIRKIKQEPEDKAHIIAVSSLQQIKPLGGILNKTAEKLSVLPITLIIDKKPEGTIAFRIPKNKTLLEITKHIPITTTSANIHGSPSIYKAEEVKAQFPNIPIIDSGDLEENQASTIFDTRNKEIIRLGSISKEEIQEVLNENNS